MKKLSLFLVAVVAAVVMTGCVGKMDNGDFPTAPAGAIITDMSGGQFVQARTADRKYTIVGPVKSEATTVCYVGLIAQGDASYQTLKKAALEGKNADDIINVELDFYQNNLLGIINKVTAKLNGVAIKYAK